MNVLYLQFFPSDRKVTNQILVRNHDKTFNYIEISLNKEAEVRDTLQ